MKKKFSNTPKSRVSQPNSTFTKDPLFSMLRCLSPFSLFIHLDWLFCPEFESDLSYSLRFVDKKWELYSETHITNFLQILIFRLELGAVKPIIDAYWNKWYQRTQKSILNYKKKRKVTSYSPLGKKIKYTKKSSRTTQYHFH